MKKPYQPNERAEETREWLESLEYIIQIYGEERAQELIKELQMHAYNSGIRFPFSAKTPYVNTINYRKEPPYPGDRIIERRIKSIIRWNAMAMVVKANRNEADIGGHISTYASSATLYEVGFNHFFRNHTKDYGGDLVFIQGHASPGIYARAYLEGRMTEEQLNNFRHEIQGKGLSSYPHPRLMPDFWQFPTVSMGIGPITAIYQARLARYLENRGLKPKNGGKIWCFVGDGETDEPETLGAIHLATREKLDNLIFVVNCNLQRLDGPVRGNSKIIQELESIFRGAGWHVIKVVWGDGWDALFEKDTNGILLKRVEEMVDGEFQKYTTHDGAFIREKFFGVSPELSKMVEHLSDEELRTMHRGGHDPNKVYAAFKWAVEHQNGPSVILAHTIKGYGLGESGEGKNITHQQKKLNEEELQDFRTRFKIPISDKDLHDIPFYKPAENSKEMQYLHSRRKNLGGYLPERGNNCQSIAADPKTFAEFFQGSKGRELSTTMAFVRMLTRLLKDPKIGKYVVPIVPDEARTFGMESLFRQAGIYSSVGQLYEPVDSDSLLYYKESKDGQILEEGINEAGAMASFIAAGTAYANYGIPTIPFYIYYSMFGFQRVGDLAWAAGDSMARGFMLGGTAGRTTLNGEGLQHQDGHSLVLSSTIPNLLTYDPAFGYEIAVILQAGIIEMYQEQKKVFYYITLENENYAMPEMPKGVEQGILKGIYRLSKTEQKGKLKAHLLASGSILNQANKAQKILNEQYNVSTDVWSVTSFGQLRRDGLEKERLNFLNPQAEAEIPYLTEVFKAEEGVCVAVSDYMKVMPDSIFKWMPLPMITLGTDGFGMSDSRANLRFHFEIDAAHVVYATLYNLFKQGQIDAIALQKAAKDLKINPKKRNPMAV